MHIRGLRGKIFKCTVKGKCTIYNVQFTVKRQDIKQITVIIKDNKLEEIGLDCNY